MHRRLCGVAVLVVVGLIASSFHGADAAMKYVKTAEIYQVMGAYTKALGVKCSFCHTKDKSQDYKILAEKRVTNEDLRALVHKRIARAMQGTTIAYNGREGKAYTCNACHQGSADVEVR